MGYFNCGANVGDAPVKTKKALREALASRPESVNFYSTSPFNEEQGYTGDAIPETVKLTVVGPDPYKDRRWFANVSVGVNGTPKVS